MSVFLSCGEPSGDALMAKLAVSLRAAGYSGTLWGMAGSQAISEGVRKVWDFSELHIMGITGALKALPRLNSLADHMVEKIMNNQPEAVVVIDSPDFHIPLVKRLRKRGYSGKTVYIAPPTVWAWRKGRVKPLRELFDLVLPLFSFEHNYLKAHGVKSLWRGHPMAEDFSDPVPPKGNIVAMLPGSRSLEVSLLTPLLLEVASSLRNYGFEPVFSVAPGLKEPLKEELRCKLTGFTVDEGPGRALLSSSAFAVGASGTVAVEAMMVDRFMIVLYKAHLLEWFIYDNFLSIPYVSIPNVLARREVYPELLQKKANFKSVMRHIWHYIDDDNYQEEVHRKLAYGRSRMGSSAAGPFWSGAIRRLLLS